MLGILGFFYFYKNLILNVFYGYVIILNLIVFKFVVIF